MLRRFSIVRESESSAKFARGLAAMGALALLSACATQGVGVDIPGALRLGTTGGNAVLGVALADLRAAHEGFFPALMDA